MNKNNKTTSFIIISIFIIIVGFFIFNIFSKNSSTNNNETAKKNTASITNDIQEIDSNATSGGYEPITVFKGIPVKWNLKVPKGELTGCNNAIVIPKYNIEKKLQVGDNIIEFTPTETGSIEFTCWMGMIRSDINVIEKK